MKILILSIFLITGLTAYSQNIDENGREKGAKANLSAIKADVSPFSKSSLSNSDNTVLTYNLPDGASSGKIVLFHPRKDIELKTVKINSNSGSISVDMASLGIKSFAAGLYNSDGKLIKSLNVN